MNYHNHESSFECVFFAYTGQFANEAPVLGPGQPDFIIAVIIINNIIMCFSFSFAHTGQFVNEAPVPGPPGQPDFYDAPHSFQTVPNIKSELPWSAQEYSADLDPWPPGAEMRGSMGMPHAAFRAIHSASPDSNCSEQAGKPVIHAATLAGYSGELNK
jgi:hypothetical protein